MRALAMAALNEMYSFCDTKHGLSCRMATKIFSGMVVAT